MEIFQWLFKLGKAPGRSEFCSINDHEPTTTLTNSERTTSSTRGSKHEKQRNYRGIWLWCRRDVAEACFNSTLTLKSLSSFRREHLCRAMAKVNAQGQGGEEVISKRFDRKKAIKVLEPEKHEESNKEKAKSEQSKAKATLSRMKELIRWAAAAKSDKAVKFFTPNKIMESRNRRKLKMMREVNEESKRMSSESAKISLRWESCESCTTLSSSDHISVVSSPPIVVSLGPTSVYRCRSRKGNWITTDSECKTTLF
ncbi:unnamed protein product [Arabis nemorensis]|uniref:Uncharacterized protein n=1 Tax=Arabis nemorensis TaxID=586526 RepID=A0A565B9Z6_9BRAS|nr:unnamed protein product [Arabis nemorensis]